MIETKLGVVLSGGGARGAGQLGMMKYLYEKGIHPDVVTGISVGSLNATMWAQEENLTLLESLWRGIKGNSDIYRTNWCQFWKLYRSLYDNTPLKRLIDKYVNLDKLKNCNMELKIGVVELQSGRYSIVDKFHSDYKSMLLASTTIPVAFNPVSWQGQQYVDGGVRNVAPLKASIDSGCTQIYLLHCFPLEMEEDQRTFKDTIAIGVRSFFIIINEILCNDIKTCERINTALKEGRADPQKNYRLIDLTVIAPSVDQRFADILSFSPESIEKDIELGYKIAKEALEGRDD